MPGAGNPPLVAGSNIIKQRGYTVLTFGTEWAGQNFQGAANTSYIVADIHSAQRADTTPCPQGSGATAVTTLVVDGQDFHITVVDDGSIAPPYVGEIVNLQNVFFQAIGNNVAPFGNGTTLVGSFQVENNDFASSRKAYGQRTILARAYALISGVTGANNPQGLNS